MIKLPELPRIVQRHLYQGKGKQPVLDLKSINAYRIQVEPTLNGFLIYPEVREKAKWKKFSVFGKLLQCKCRRLGMMGSGANLSQRRVNQIRDSLDEWMQSWIKANRQAVRKDELEKLPKVDARRRALAAISTTTVPDARESVVPEMLPSEAEVRLVGDAPVF